MNRCCTGGVGAPLDLPFLVWFSAAVRAHQRGQGAVESRW